MSNLKSDNDFNAKVEALANKPVFPMHLLLCPSSKGMTFRELLIVGALEGALANPSNNSVSKSALATHVIMQVDEQLRVMADEEAI